MHIAFLVITIVYPLLLALSGTLTIRRDARQVQVIHTKLGVPLKYFWLLAACKFAAALGLLTGIWWPALGVAAGIGAVLFFVGAIAAHLRVGDFKGIGAATFMLVLAAAALILRILTYTAGIRV
jgi:hypothetical protein